MTYVMPRPAVDRLVARAHEAVSPALALSVSEVRIASPYLGPGPMRELLLVAQKPGSMRRRLLTSLDPAAVSVGVLDLNGVRAAMRAGVAVRTLENLHAKVYL